MVDWPPADTGNAQGGLNPHSPAQRGAFFARERRAQCNHASINGNGFTRTVTVINGPCCFGSKLRSDRETECPFEDPILRSRWAQTLNLSPSTAGNVSHSAKCVLAPLF